MLDISSDRRAEESGEMGMTDREKVIKGLECCVLFKGFECTNRNCPYWEDCSATSTSNELLHDVLAMMKAQEPVEPTWRHGYAFCGKCGRHFGRGYKYCPDCGQAVKWDG